MADQDLNLRVNVETATVGALRTALKSVKSDLDAVSADDPRRPALIQEYVGIGTAIKNADDQLKRSLPTWEVARQHIRTARVEQRALNFAIVELMHGFEGLATATALITGANATQIESTKQLITTLQGAAGAGLGVKFAMDMLPASFAAAGSYIASFVALATIIGTVMGRLNEIKQQGLKQQAQSNAEAIQEYQKQLLGLSPELAEGRLNELQKQRNDILMKEVELKKQIATETNVFLKADAEDALNALPNQLRGLEQRIQATKNYLDLAKLDNQYSKEKAENEKESQKLAESRLPLANKLVYDANLQAEILAQTRDTVKEMNDFRPTVGPGGIVTRVLFGENIPAGTDPATYIALEMSKIQIATLQELSPVTESLRAGFEEVGMGIEQNIHQKLVNAFNGANSVAQQFFIGVMMQLERIATQYATNNLIAGLLSFIPGVGTFSSIYQAIGGTGKGIFSASGNFLIPEPVAGIGTQSGRPYMFGESGMEVAKSRNGYGIAASSGQNTTYTLLFPPINIGIKGQDLRTVVNTATLVVNNRSMSISGTR
jgi:hypothetical protein